MVNKWKGLGAAVYKFLIVGVIAPLAIDYLRPAILRYIGLPPSQEIWIILGVFGVLFAVTAFFQNAYVKGDFPWLFGKLGGGAVTLAFYAYLFLVLPGTSSIAGSDGFQGAGLLALIYVSIGLSYLHLFLDFADARRSRQRGAAGNPSNVTPSK
ncbi:MAG: hypothetical protein OK422_02105 [Thaumarchaeota archaeon]|nr:hypothetical protein [Nitrososphaerota archaeon]